MRWGCQRVNRRQIPVVSSTEDIQGTGWGLRRQAGAGRRNSRGGSSRGENFVLGRPREEIWSGPSSRKRR
jgi:hypothetical protein